ncbi:hypothetical protein AAFP30_07085 [Gordonia sp. CPCC 205515]|uniref:hypothetical protein n=1 Tax=Gordonia sp. CPCC 205515 TaxID=3140791 RepID=UPI003AF36855
MSDKPAKKEYFRAEHGRNVPKSAWAVLGLAVVVLFAFILARPSWFTRDAGDDSIHVPPERHFTKTLAASGQPDGLWLTDDSPSASYLVALPADSARSHTRLHLVGSSQVPTDSTIFLSVKMDGQEVSKTELPTGQHDIDSFYAIPDQIASDGQVRVQVTASGTRDNQHCTTDHSAGIAVHLAPDSLVEAALAEPVHTIRDAVASWDRQVTVVLTDRGNTWRSTAAQMGMSLTRAGHEVVFADHLPDADIDNAILLGPADTLKSQTGWTTTQDMGNGVAVGTANNTPVLGVTEPDGTLISSFLTDPTVATADSASSDPSAVTSPTVTGDRVPLASLGADMSSGQITETKRWRINYSLTDLPGGRIPAAVDVDIALPASPDDIRWLLNVDLNGTLAASRNLNTTGGKTSIPLPAQNALLDNTVTLSVQRDRDLGGCDVRITPYPMQLQPGSQLVLGTDPGAGFTAAARAMASGVSVYLPNTDADPIQQLNAIVPTLTEFVPAQYDPPFAWNQQPAAGKPFILVGDSPTVTTPVAIRDGRILSEPDGRTLNIPAFQNGLVVSTATGATRAPGLAIDYVGGIGDSTLPDFGTEVAQVVTAQGSFAVNADGTVGTSAR